MASIYVGTKKSTPLRLETAMPITLTYCKDGINTKTYVGTVEKARTDEHKITLAIRVPGAKKPIYRSFRREKIVSLSADWKTETVD